ncbi:MAG: PAS domain S-box protein [Hyphomicrobiaceae bacterium]
MTEASAVEPNPSGTNVDALTLKAILDTAAAAILAIDARGIVRDCNPATSKLFGYTRDEMIGRNVAMLMARHDRSRHDDYIGRYLRTGETRIMGVGREVVGMRKDGTLFPLHLSIGEYRVDGERFFTGVMIDLSRQRLAEDSLARQQALFRAVFDCMPDPLIITDCDRRVQSVNPAFTRTFGHSLEAVFGNTPECIFASPEEWRRHDSVMSHPCTHQAADLGLHVSEFRRPNGETFPAAVVRTEILAPDFSPLGYLELIRDISGERRREAQLMQAQRMEAIGQLTGGIAHDFNNILTVVLGNVELIEMRATSDDLLSLAREAREASEIGARLTDRLLTFGRRQMLETRKINLNEFVLGLSELIRRTIGEDIDVSTALASDLASTEVDPGQVENAVLNLAINARDAMPRGGRLVVETRNVHLERGSVDGLSDLVPGDYVALSVSDTGHGMPPEVQARAFEPFFSTKDKGKGNGLGLATIYGFAKQSGGHVTIASAVGRGTTVELLLPAVREDGAVPAPPAAGVATTFGNGERILVVEDNDSLRRLTRRRLVELGYRVIEAENGVVALEVLATERDIDLVFSDVVMPGGINGVDLAREIRRHFPRVAVVLTTGYADAILAQDEGDSADRIVLRKPYHQSELARTVAEALTGMRE